MTRALVKNKEEFEQAKKTACELVEMLHKKHGDNIYISIQASLLLSEALLDELAVMTGNETEIESERTKMKSFIEADEIDPEDLEAAATLHDNLKNNKHYTNDKECPICHSTDIQSDWQYVLCNKCNNKWRLQ